MGNKLYFIQKCRKLSFENSEGSSMITRTSFLDGSSVFNCFLLKLLFFIKQLTISGYIVDEDNLWYNRRSLMIIL